MRESVHGIFIDEQGNQLFKFGFFTLAWATYRTFYLPLNPSETRPKVEYDNKHSAKTSQSIIKLHQTILNILKTSEWLVYSLDCLDQLSELDKLGSYDLELKPELGFEDANYFIGIFIIYFKLLVDDITDSIHLFYRCLNQKDVYTFKKFTYLRTDIDKLLNIDPKLVDLIKQNMDWFDRLNSLRNAFIHDRTTITSVKINNEYSPMLNDEARLISNNLIVDLRNIIIDFFKFMDVVFYHFYDQFLPIYNINLLFQDPTTSCVFYKYPPYFYPPGKFDFLRLFPKIN